MTNKPVRVRYAPSPTGHPHVGNIRTALFNWLFARHNGGRFIVRIEDTDVARRVEGSVESILGGLKWLGMDWDEGPEVGGEYGPYVQSERLELYHQAAEKLVAEGHAYRCYCSPQRLTEMRNEQAMQKQPPGYDRHCRNLSLAETAELEASGIKPVIRFKFPAEGQTVIKDLIRGEVTFDNAVINDFVIMKSDGFPTYHLASIVDDHLMEISHILRAEEWLSSTPSHLALYKALGYEPPLFGHMPILLGTDRSKLSKRHGAVSITDYQREGFLPEAMFNFLALLGWSLDDKTEQFTQQELIKYFTLERVGKTGAIFNREKLEWLNGVYIRSLSPEEFANRAMPFLEKGLGENIPRPLNNEYACQIMPLIQERAKTLAEIPSLVDFFFAPQLEYEPELLIGKKMDAAATLKALESSLSGLEGLNSFDDESMESLLRPMAEELGLKVGQLFGALRVAVTGRTVAPPLFGTMTVLGRELSLERIAQAIAKLHQMEN